MGVDPILTETPLVIPAGLIICLVALTVTAWPVLAGEHATDRRRRQAVWGSWACLATALISMVTSLIPGLYGFLALAAVAVVSSLTLLRSRHLPA